MVYASARSLCSDFSWRKNVEETSKVCIVCGEKMEYLHKNQLYACHGCKRLETDLGKILYRGQIAADDTEPAGSCCGTRP